MKYPPHQLQFVNLESTKKLHALHSLQGVEAFISHMFLCTQKNFCTQEFFEKCYGTQFFSHTEITEFHRIYPHGILCIPWILCETPHTRFFAHRNHRITQNLSAWHSVCSVNFCVKHHTQDFSHSTEFHRNLLATLVFHSAWCESKAPRSSVYSVNSV